MGKSRAVKSFALKAAGASLPLVWLTLAAPAAVAQGAAVDANAAKRFTDLTRTWRRFACQVWAQAAHFYHLN